MRPLIRRIIKIKTKNIRERQIRMNYTHFEISPKELKKDLRQAEKYGRMIDPKEVIEGAEFISTVLCKGCNKISLKLNIKECKKC